jgi:hypothetical protein
MRRPATFPVLLALLLAALLALPAPAATKKRKKGRKSAAPKPTPAARPYYGPPAPTPVPYLRAAGACMEYTPGRYVVVAEVGAQGRVFRLDEETRIEVDVRKGARLRILYLDGPEGPVARRILAGPVAEAPRNP